MESQEFNYDDCAPIKGRESTVWKVIFDDGEERIQVLDIGFIDDPKRIIEMIKVHNPTRKFYITPIDVGEFVMTKTIISYSNDARFIDSDLKSGLK